MSIISGLLSSDSQDKATEAATSSNDAAQAEQGRQFDITQQNFEPFRKIGAVEAPIYQKFINGQTPDISADPLYKNEMRTATREATQRAAGAGQSTDASQDRRANH